MSRLGKFLPLVALVGVTTAALIGCPPVVTNSLLITNQTYMTMSAINIKAEDDTAWGRNQLPAALTAFDSNHTVTAIPDGMYDFRATFSTAAAGSTGYYYRFTVPVDGMSNWEWLFTLVYQGANTNIYDILRGI